MMVVNWLEQHLEDVPPEEVWLSSAEAAQLERLRIEKRRTDWKIGRWTAKRAVAAFLQISPSSYNLASIEIVPGCDGAPVARLKGTIAPAGVSISHCDGTAMCAVIPRGHSVGCDIERVQTYSQNFLSDYFTEEEQELILRSPAFAPSLLWSAKESVMKLLHTGLRVDTRAISVSLTGTGDDNWHGFQATFSDESTFRGWWCLGGGFVRTVTAFPPAAAPVLLASGMVDVTPYNILPFGKISAEQSWPVSLHS